MKIMATHIHPARPHVRHHVRHRVRLPILLLLLLPLLLLCIATHARAQGLDPLSAGRTYVIAFPDTTSNLYDQRQDSDTRFTPREPRQDSVFIMVYTAAENTVDITDNYGYRKHLVMSANSSETVFLNGNPRASRPIVTQSGVVTNGTFRIEAAQPVIVYCFMVTRFGTEAFTPIPVEYWGKDHYAAALPGEVLYDEIPGGENNYGKQPKKGPSEILVIAAHDNTRVTITPNDKLEGNPPTTVTLNKGECYQVQSYVDSTYLMQGLPEPDLGGTYISSNKPVGVISGNTRAQVLDVGGGLAKNSFKNMMIEWLPPVDQHGTQFVYLPTWDDRRPTGTPGEKPEDLRQGEVIRIYGTAGHQDDTPPTITEGVDIEGESGSITRTYKIPRTKFFETLIGAPVAHVFKTDKPAEAFMNTTAVVKFNGTTGGGNFIGATYEAWATYMVQLVPREQWTWTAPYYAPVHPPKMNHFMNIVTDEKSKSKIKVGGAAMVFNRQIPGTDLWWGTKTLVRGDKGLIEGADSTCKFYAFVYGAMKGFETYRPGRTRKDGDGSGSAGARDRRAGGTDQVLHPSEYEENIGFMYGYPVAARHRSLRGPDQLRIDTSRECSTLQVKIKATNADPVGLADITLEEGNNAKLVFVHPASGSDLAGGDSAYVKVAPIDARKNSSGTLVITDRTGNTWRIIYTGSATVIDLSSMPLDFGTITAGRKATRRFAFTSPIAGKLGVTGISLRSGDRVFSLDSVRPRPPFVLQQGDSLVLMIGADAPATDGIYADTLVVAWECGSFIIPIIAKVDASPCLYVDDLNFGPVDPTGGHMLRLRICNKGGGVVSFVDPYLTHFQDDFVISADELAKLKTAALASGDCISLNVLFNGRDTGSYLDKVRLWASTRDCRDTALLLALVIGASGVNDGNGSASGSAAGYRFGAIEPNPFSSTATISFDLGARGMTTVEIFDATGRRAATLVEEPLDRGEHRIGFDGGTLPSGIYYCRIVSGAWSITRPVLLVR